MRSRRWSPHEPPSPCPNDRRPRARGVLRSVCGRRARPSSPRMGRGHGSRDHRRLGAGPLSSKSGPEVALALGKLSQSETGHIAAWINIAGVLGGSPLADAALSAPRCWAALALFGWKRLGVDGMKSMSTLRRRGELGDIRIPEHVLVVSYVPLPLSGQVSPRAREGYADLRSLGPNDGLALTFDEIFPGGATLVEVGLDHYLAAAQGVSAGWTCRQTQLSVRWLPVPPPALPGRQGSRTAARRTGARVVPGFGPSTRWPRRPGTCSASR